MSTRKSKSMSTSKSKSKRVSNIFYWYNSLSGGVMIDPAKIKKIAINTGGGDAPGLNAVIRAVTLASLQQGWEVWESRTVIAGWWTPT